MKRSAVLKPLLLATLCRQLAAARRHSLHLLPVLQILAEDDLWPRRARQLVHEPEASAAPFEILCDIPRYKLPFPPAAVDLMLAAEGEGALVETLEALSDDFVSLNSTRNSFQTAVFWPFTALMVLVVVLVVSNLFVLPAFEAMYRQLGINAPTSTRTLRIFVDSTIGLWWLWLPLCAGLVIMTVSARWPFGFRSRLAGWCFLLPFVRRYLTDRYVIRTARWLGVLTSNSSLQTQILTYLGDTQLVPALQRSSRRVGEALIAGADYSTAVTGPLLPRRMGLFLKVGQASNDVSGALQLLVIVTAAAEQESRVRFERGVLLTSYVVVGFMVGLFVWGMYGSITNLAAGL